MENNLKYIKELTEEEFDELLRMYSYDGGEPSEDCLVVSDDLDVWCYQDLQKEIKRNETSQKYLSTVIDFDKERKQFKGDIEGWVDDWAGFYDWDIENKIEELVKLETSSQPSCEKTLHYFYELFFKLKTATSETKSNIQNEIEEAYIEKINERVFGKKK